MTYQDFVTAYDGDLKQTVTYRTAAGETLKGLLITYIWHSLSGVPCVCVNNFNTNIPLADVIAIKTTATAW